MPIKKSKSNTVKKVSKPVKSSTTPAFSVHQTLNYPLVFLCLLTVLAVLISLGYFYSQQYKYMRKMENGNVEKKYDYKNGMNNSKDTQEQPGKKAMLSGSEWVWEKSDKFVLKFNTDGSFSSTTDCNGLGGNYMVSGMNRVALFDIVSTKMYCDGSMESDYTEMLSKVSSYSMLDDSLELTVSDGSTLVFMRK